MSSVDALVVYESHFGCARQVAEAVADGLAARVDVRTVGVAAVPRMPSADLLVVGGPNHHFGLSSRRSRREATTHGAAEAPVEVGLREWLADLRRGSAELVAGVYDTRLARPRFLELADHASRAIVHGLRGHGIEVLGPAQHFLVAEVTGPLLPGEVERATVWGYELGRAVVRNAAARR